MSTTKSKNTESTFSYNKLIWPIFILLVLLIFRTPIENLLSGSDDVAVEVLGVKIKIAKSDIEELDGIQKEFEEEIKSLNDTISQQSELLSHLAELNKELEKKSKKCPDVKRASEQFSKDVDEIMKNNSALRSKAVTLGKKELFKISKEEKQEEDKKPK